MVGIFKGYQDYSEFVNEMENDLWHREQIAIDNTNAALAVMATVGVNTTGAVITITCPPGRVMSVMGTQQVPAGADRGTAHAFWMRLASSAVGEIHELTHINIQKTTPSTAVVPLIHDIYQSLGIIQQHNMDTMHAPTGTTAAVGNLYKSDDMIHRFRKGIILYGQEQMQVQVVNTAAQANQGVVLTFTQFSLDTDLWTKTV
jgi:hypothetical protein